MLLVSRWTLRRRVVEYGLQDVTGFSNITDEQLDNIIRCFMRDHGMRRMTCAENVEPIKLLNENGLLELIKFLNGYEVLELVKFLMEWMTEFLELIKFLHRY